nr:MAG TPA: hypothetical protein [Caudoviricetes sp.]
MVKNYKEVSRPTTNGMVYPGNCIRFSTSAP